MSGIIFGQSWAWSCILFWKPYIYNNKMSTFWIAKDLFF